MSSSWFEVVADLRGSRRHRFMESADYTAANRWAFNTFANSIASGSFWPPIFVGFEMDSATPGVILTATAIPVLAPGFAPPSAADPISIHGWVARAIASIQNAEDSPYALVAFASAVRTRSVSPSAAVGERKGVRVQVASVDKSLSAVHLLPAGRAKLTYSPLCFVLSE